MAFPVCISVNELCGHYSPMKEESIKLQEGDVAKMYKLLCGKFIL